VADIYVMFAWIRGPERLYYSFWSKHRQTGRDIECGTFEKNITQIVVERV
jgi:hypothetical protein